MADTTLHRKLAALQKAAARRIESEVTRLGLTLAQPVQAYHMPDGITAVIKVQATEAEIAAYAEIQKALEKESDRVNAVHIRQRIAAYQKELTKLEAKKG